MKKKTSAVTIGLDLGDRKHAVCVLDVWVSLQFRPETRYVRLKD